jgi:SAM-dependent methyltransferase
MRILQPVDELEKWWEKPDPWEYGNNPDDLNRRAMLLSVIPQRQYGKTLDIGCGNGFVTARLPGSRIIGVDISRNAIEHAKTRSRGSKHIRYQQNSLFDIPELGWSEAFDLIIITGVLYPQYIGKSLKAAYILIDNILKKGGVLVSCHIDEWYACRFPYFTVSRDYYPYKQYNHILEVYQK